MYEILKYKVCRFNPSVSGVETGLGECWERRRIWEKADFSGFMGKWSTNRTLTDRISSDTPVYFLLLISACAVYGFVHLGLCKPSIFEPHRSSTFDMAKIYFNDIVSKSYLLLPAFKHNKLKRLDDGPLAFFFFFFCKNNVINLFKKRRISASCARTEIKLSSGGEHQLKTVQKMQ